MLAGRDDVLPNTRLLTQETSSLRAMLADFESDARGAAIVVTGLDEIAAHEFVARAARFTDDGQIAMHRAPLESP